MRKSSRSCYGHRLPLIWWFEGAYQQRRQ